MKHSTLALLIISSLLILFVLFLSEAQAQIPVDIYIMVMCATTDVDPFYNCDEKWVLYYYPNISDVYELCHQKQAFHMAVAGCATYDDERGHSLILGSHVNSKSHTGQSVLEHELLHLKCRCNFHG